MLGAVLDLWRLSTAARPTKNRNTGDTDVAEAAKYFLYSFHSLSKYSFSKNPIPLPTLSDPALAAVE